MQFASRELPGSELDSSGQEVHSPLLASSLYVFSGQGVHEVCDVVCEPAGHTLQPCSVSKPSSVENFPFGQLLQLLLFMFSGVVEKVPFAQGVQMGDPFSELYFPAGQM